MKLNKIIKTIIFLVFVGLFALPIVLMMNMSRKEQEEAVQDRHYEFKEVAYGEIMHHNFYLGYTGKAVTQLVISVLGILLAFLFFGIPNFIIGVWALIESIMILCGNIKTDAKGVPLKD